MIFFLILLAPSLFALPPFKSIYEAKYGYKVNCNLCHLDDGWDLNSYGLEYLRQGLGAGALSALEAVDADRDGFLTKDEITAKSNPGDPASTPKRTGKWLERIIPIKPPVKNMSQIFPQALSYSVLERALTEEEIKRLRDLARVKSVDDVDHYAVVFLAKEAQGVAGGSSYVAVLDKGSKKPELNVFLLTVNPNGKILDVSPMHTHRKDFKKKEFLESFRNLFASDLSQIQFPKGVPPELRETVRAQFAKHASQIDILIGP